MKRLLGHISLIIWAVFTPIISWCQDQPTTFEMTVSKDILGVNERLRVDFTMNKDGDHFSPPNFDAFEVLMGPSQSISSSWINGKRSFSKSFTFILRPLKEGKITIGSATVEIGGQTYTTESKVITATAAVKNPNAPKSVEEVADENIVLVAQVSNNNPYLNQAITIIYKLYVGPEVLVSNFRPVENPKYNNFWSQDIPVTKFNSKAETYNGKPFQSVILKRVVLYPQKEGVLEIEPLALDLFVDVPTNRVDFFGRKIYTQATKRVTAGNRDITVKPLPEEGKPADFGGAVGDFTFELSTSKTSLKATESLQATLKVQGDGNLGLFKMPELTLPSALEVYEPEFKEDTRVTLSGITGQVSNAYTVVPSYQGRYPVPSVSFSYFNPNSKQYITLKSDEITIDVTDGPLAQASNANATNTRVPQVVGGGTQNFNFIKTQTILTPISKRQFYNSTLFYALLLLPLLLIPLVWMVKKYRETSQNDIEGNSIKKANRLAKKYLGEAKARLSQEDAFYVALEKALHNYLKAKLKIKTAEMSKDKIASLLHKKKVAEEPLNQLLSLLGNCEMARYSPFSLAQMERDYEKASWTLNALDKQL